MGLLRNLLIAIRPLADERPFEPLVRPRPIQPNEFCTITMDASSIHPVISTQLRRIDDAAGLVDHLRSEGISIFRLSFVDANTAQRLLDFLCGAVILQQGGLYRIAGQTYLLTPHNVCVDDALLRKLESYGFYTSHETLRRQRLA